MKRVDVAEPGPIQDDARAPVPAPDRAAKPNRGTVDRLGVDKHHLPHTQVVFQFLFDGHRSFPFSLLRLALANRPLAAHQFNEVAEQLGIKLLGHGILHQLQGRE